MYISDCSDLPDLFLPHGTISAPTASIVALDQSVPGIPYRVFGVAGTGVKLYFNFDVSLSDNVTKRLWDINHESA